MTLTDKELKLINSKDGLMALLNQEELETKEVCVGYTNIYRKSTIQ